MKKIKTLKFLAILFLGIYNTMYCYQYKFQSVSQIKKFKSLSEYDKIEMSFGEGFLIRGSYNDAMFAMKETLENCSKRKVKLVLKKSESQFLNWKYTRSEKNFNAQDLDLTFWISDFEHGESDITKATLFASGEFKKDLYFEIDFLMKKSWAPFYKNYYFNDPGKESGEALAKEICLNIP